MCKEIRSITRFRSWTTVWSFFDPSLKNKNNNPDIYRHSVCTYSLQICGILFLLWFAQDSGLKLTTSLTAAVQPKVGDKTNHKSSKFNVVAHDQGMKNCPLKASWHGILRRTVIKSETSCIWWDSTSAAFYLQGIGNMLGWRILLIDPSLHHFGILKNRKTMSEKRGANLYTLPDNAWKNKACNVQI